ncbi:RNA polymerase-associated protein LEO1 [Auxenochlorella protothecoides]|uniref:RNA polymerase-associated protein LEO1 n=1 Tax=Auxenochlorella protothecoides TaxID=3075 RepID=A0A087SLK2_AUXPR|nr:RNA polymerase-associated protein LEO1 [Auxenochlorella protothecoides]KFM26606.1 RNA polymerase-associated protein LEO1 [Auxenochlorella protothecoides]RMZ56009.1 hypothetical protein APUTEX25_004433 [Auxenochlorella protothecoides]|eukprot:RMZ56009.1 hypothetical protein APUTEX25_004433 [Auxenochlorella protothecoides]
MAEEGDRMRELFGSESEDDDGPLPASTAPQAGPDDEGPGPAPAPVEQDQMRDLFGSDDEDEAASQGGDATAWDDADDGLGAPPPDRGPPMEVEVPLHSVPLPSSLHLVKMSNILGIEARPFDAQAFAAEAGASTARERLRDHTTIRWRWGRDAAGAAVQRSNARLVRWSDGSQQLLLGSEVLDVRDIDVSGDQNYLCARHAQVIQGQGQLLSKLVFQPASLSSGFHRRLAASVEGTSARVGRVKGTTTLADPARQKRERELAEEGRIRDRERLAERQARTMRRFAPPAAPARAPRLSSAYLEEDDDEALFGDEAVDAKGRGGPRGVAARGLDSEEAEARAAARLVGAKRAAPASSPAPARPRTIDSEDEGLSEEDNLDDFLAPDDDEPEAPPRKPSAPKQAPAPATAPRAKKRTVLLDSDDDE